MINKVHLKGTEKYTNIDGINRPNMLKATTEMKNGECES